MKCPKCGYDRQPTDDAPDWQCPSCQVAYVKALQAQNAATALAEQKAAENAQAKQPNQSRIQQNQKQQNQLPPDKDESSTANDLGLTAEEEQQLDRLVLAAQGQKMLIVCVALSFVLRAIERAQVLPTLTTDVLSLAVAVIALAGIIKICTALDKDQNQKIRFMVLAFFPLINLVVFMYLSVKTSKLLRAAGWQVGLLGGRP